MLVCVNKDASLHGILLGGSNFCINVLSSLQKELAEVCSNSEEGESRFLSKSWKELDSYIFNEDALSNIFCTITNQVDHTSHTVFIGTVNRVINNADLKPLLYGSGGYL